MSSLLFFPGPQRVNYCIETMFAMYGVSHVMMLMDVYESPVASTDILFENDRGQFCVKFLFVMSPTDKILHLSCWPGSLSNLLILKHSDLGRLLKDPMRPVQYPG